MRVTGDVLSSGAKIAAHAAPLLLGLGKEKKPSEWNTLVAKVRKETGKSLKDTLKHIKENNLYKKKKKTKNDGTTRTPYTNKKSNTIIKP